MEQNLTVSFVKSGSQNMVATNYCWGNFHSFLTMCGKMIFSMFVRNKNNELSNRVYKPLM